MCIIAMILLKLPDFILEDLISDDMYLKHMALLKKDAPDKLPDQTTFKAFEPIKPSLHMVFLVVTYIDMHSFNMICSKKIDDECNIFGDMFNDYLIWWFVNDWLLGLYLFWFGIFKYVHE